MIKDMQAQYPGRFPGWFASTDITRPDAETLLTNAIHQGAKGFGELKFHVEAAAPNCGASTRWQPIWTCPS